MKDGPALGVGEASAAIQVVCLGSTGGPGEDNVTGFLVRATASRWAKGSLLAVDAGSHLSAITRILEQDFPLYSGASEPAAPPLKANYTSNPAGDYDVSPKSAQIDAHYDGFSSDTPSSTRQNSPVPPTPITTLESGAFGGVPFPHASARANALHLVREHVATYLITHPHLDHHGGFVMNTAAFHNTSRPKRLAALPFTVNAIKTHVFNDVIWPNLTDEDGGVGFVTFQRLAEGGNIALGDGHSRGYIEVCDGLAVKGFKVSHGHCMKGPSHVHRGSIPNALELASAGLPLSHNTQGAITANGREGRSLSFSALSNPGTPMPAPSVGPGSTDHGGNQCVIDSTAFFIRAETPRSESRRSASAPSVPGAYGPSAHPPSREVLVFGDVEPDSISLTPRTARVWSEAAPKIAAGILKGIFIECSYPDSQPDAVLFGHLAPRHLFAELCALADMVREVRRERERERLVRKRKRNSRHMEVDEANGAGGDAAAAGTPDARRRRSRPSLLDDAAGERNPQHLMTIAAGLSPPVEKDAPTWDAPPDADVTPPRSRSVAGLPSHTHAHAHQQTPAAQAATVNSVADLQPPLAGLTVVVIHVKDTYQDGPPVGQQVLAELRAHDEALAKTGRSLGCQFEVSSSGASYWF